MIKKIGVIVIVIMTLCNVVYADTLIYTYETTKGETTILVDGVEVEPNDPILKDLNSSWKATSVQIGSDGWSVECTNSGSGCWDVIEETMLKYELLY